MGDEMGTFAEDRRDGAKVERDRQMQRENVSEEMHEDGEKTEEQMEDEDFGKIKRNGRR